MTTATLHNRKDRGTTDWGRFRLSAYNVLVNDTQMLVAGDLYPSTQIPSYFEVAQHSSRGIIFD